MGGQEQGTTSRAARKRVIRKLVTNVELLSFFLNQLGRVYSKLVTEVTVLKLSDALDDDVVHSEAEAEEEIL